MRAASRAIGVGMVLALQGQGSCPPLSPNLVCIPLPPTDIKADGAADTAHKISAIALPLSRAARAVRPNERAPLRGGAAQPTRGGGGRTEEHRRSRADERARRNERSEERAIITLKRPTGTNAPLKGARETGVFDRLDARLLKLKRLIKTASLLTQMSERSELHISGRVKKSKDFSIFFN